MKCWLVAFLMFPSSVWANAYGPAKVVDGDTLKIGNESVRLHGIDAPESEQNCQDGKGKVYACGAIATDTLRKIIGNQAVNCKGNERDKYGRLIAACRVGRTNLNAAMVSSGMALAYRKYSQEFVLIEQVARTRKRGLWGGRFVEPWEWRRGKRMSSQAANESRAGQCDIKGNIGSNGARVYHTKDSLWYAQTKINIKAGERWFCTEAEAKAAGWRPARSPQSGTTTQPVPLKKPSTTPSITTVPSTTQSPAMSTPTRACCKVCRKGKACGNSCISRRYTCRRPPGCACDG